MSGFDFTQLIEEALDKGAELEHKWQLQKSRRRLALELRGIRMMAGLSESDLAEMAGCDVEMIRRIESRRPPLPENEIISSLIEICEEERVRRRHLLRPWEPQRLIRQRDDME